MRLPPLPAWGVERTAACSRRWSPATPRWATSPSSNRRPPDGADAVPAEAELLAAQHAASVYALALMRERLAAEVTTELRDELLEGLLVRPGHRRAGDPRARPPPGLRRVAGLPGPGVLVRRTTPRAARRCLAAPMAPRGPPVGAAACSTASPSSCATARPRPSSPAAANELVVLLPDGLRPPPPTSARTVTLYVASMYPEWPVTVGIGGQSATAPREISPAPTPRPVAPPRSRCASAAGARSSTSTTSGFYRLLFQISTTATSCVPSSSRSSARCWSTTASTAPTSSSTIRSLPHEQQQPAGHGEGALRPRQHRRLPHPAHPDDHRPRPLEDRGLPARPRGPDDPRRRSRHLTARSAPLCSCMPSGLPRGAAGDSPGNPGAEVSQPRRHPRRTPLPTPCPSVAVWHAKPRPDDVPNLGDATHPRILLP